MLQLIWGILNLLFILSFFYLLIGLVVKGRKFLEPYSKVVTFPILILGVLGFLSNSVSEEKHIPVFTGLATVEEWEVSQNLTNSIKLVLMKDKKTGEIINDHSYSTAQGFVLGLQWKHLGVIEHENRIEVLGGFTYKFFGSNVFSSIDLYVIEKNKEKPNQIYQ